MDPVSPARRGRGRAQGEFGQGDFTHPGDPGRTGDRGRTGSAGGPGPAGASGAGEPGHERGAGGSHGAGLFPPPAHDAVRGGLTDATLARALTDEVLAAS